MSWLIHRTDGHVVSSFIKAPADRIVDTLNSWGRTTGYFYIRTDAEVPDTLSELATPPDRCVLLQSRNGWTAMFDNDRICNIPYSTLSYLSERLRTIAVGIMLSGRSEPLTARGRSFDYFDGTRSPIKTRSIAVIRDRGRWEFRSNGEPLLYEDTGQYERRRIGERLTDEMILSYGIQMGLEIRSDNDWNRRQAESFRIELRACDLAGTEADMIDTMKRAASEACGTPNIMVKLLRRLWPS